jgi:serine/threonine protein kinase
LEGTMTIECPKCQQENPDDTAFCGKCGTKFDTDIGPTKTIETTKEELTTGSIFAGRYKIIEELGKGGMGKVYRVFDQKLNEEVALKLIKPDIASDKKTIERFKNELKLARKISHKNVGRMYEFLEDKDTHFITMEYISGQDLKGLIRQTGQLTVGKAISIAKQICDGLSEAHSLGIVHRDLKPNNIMIDRDGNAKIMDFGIARALKGKSITGSGVSIGTPQYMSPEQVEGKDVDQRSDIYSLGIILYEMLTDRVPFEGDAHLIVGVKQKTETPKDPKEINERIPDNLNHLILKCLEKDRENRYQNAVDIRSDLDNLELGLPTADRVIPERKTVTSKEVTVTFGMKKVLSFATAFVVIVIVAILLIWKKSPKLDSDLVAVGIFENQTGNTELDNLGRMACERIAQGVKEIGLFEVVPVQTVVMVSQEFQKGDYVQSIAQKTEASTVISGTYYLQGNFFQFQS